MLKYVKIFFSYKIISIFEYNLKLIIMKTFKDLEFKNHPISETKRYKDAKQALYHFENNYGVSVVFGSCFYSNGIDTYEVAILYKDELTYNTGITNGVLGHLLEEEVTEVMKKVQSLKE